MSPTPRTSSFASTGSCRVGLELDSTVVSCGETLVGRVILRGGRTTQQVETAVAYFERRDSDLDRLVYARTCWNNLVVNAGDTQRLEFNLAVPDRVSMESPKQVCVTARAVGDMAATSGLSVRILPLPCFVELASALASVARIPVTHWLNIGGGDGVAARFVPDGPAREVFDGLRLEMFRSGPNLYGELEIDPRERSLRDRLRAATGADRRRIPFNFRSLDTDEVRNFFVQCLRPYLDAVRQLPIPSGGTPRDGAVLPRPSDGRRGYRSEKT